MPAPAEPAAEPACRSADVETSPEMNDDEFDYEDGDDEEGGEALAGDALAATNAVPVWRLIEMSREDRKLQEELADFEDYDDFGDDYAEMSR